MGTDNITDQQFNPQSNPNSKISSNMYIQLGTEEIFIGGPYMEAYAVKPTQAERLINAHPTQP